MTALVGLAVWLGALFLLPGPLAMRITLGAPLVLVPRLLSEAHSGLAHRLGGAIALLAALPLIFAAALPPGMPAALLTVPWLALCGAVAAEAVWRSAPLLPGILHPRRALEIAAVAALGFLALGASSLVADRLGARPFGFSSEIILLTATHFHFAGFGLLTLASTPARRGPAIRAAILALVVGFPVTATAFLLPSDELNALGATTVGLAGTVVAFALLLDQPEGWRTWVRRAAGLALLLGVPMGIAWSWSLWLGFDFIGMDTMVRTHGVLNAAGILAAALAHHGSSR